MSECLPFGPATRKPSGSFRKVGKHLTLWIGGQAGAMGGTSSHHLHGKGQEESMGLGNPGSHCFSKFWRTIRWDGDSFSFSAGELAIC
jgi:hypothetical protein